MDQPLQRLQQFLRELRRRNVYRVAAAYVGVAFVGFQAARLLIPSTVLPGWSDEFFLFFLIVGFPVAVVVAWAFEVTPEGVKRTGATGSPAENGETSEAARVVSGDAGTSGPSDQSVAVLPFTDMSPGRDHEYFGEGLAEEVLNALTQLEGLRVASRTSAFAYRDREADVREIARELGVATVVEGSVRRAGDRLRVTAQLIDARDGYRLWSDTFDRTFEDVLVIQEVITAAIVDALQVELLGDEADRLSRVGTESPEAYDLYLKGRHYWHRRHGVGLSTALEYFEAALEEDPDFALAHAGVTEVYWVLAVYGMVEPETGGRRATEAADRAVELGPDLSEAHRARAVVQGDIRYDLAGAVKEFERALELDATDAQAEASRSCYLAAMGEMESSSRAVRRAVELDSESVYVRSLASATQLIRGRDADAAREADRALREDPEAVVALYVRALVHSRHGEHEEAIERLERVVSLTHRADFALALLGVALGRAGRRDEAVEILERLAARQAGGEYVAPQFLAMVEAHVGRTGEALDHLEEHLVNRYPGLGPLLPLGVLDVLRGRPRYDNLMKEVGLAAG